MALISNGDQVLTKRVYNSDETVLWEGKNTSTINLSESVTNFERFRIYDNIGNVREFYGSAEIQTQTHFIRTAGVSNLYIQDILFVFDTDFKVMTLQKSLEIIYGYSTNPTITYNVNNRLDVFRKVVGINRKEGV